MSYELKLRNQCPHIVIEERHTLEVDKRSVRFLRQPANLADIKVRINGYSIIRDDSKFSWQILRDEFRVDDGVKLVFNSEIKLENPLIEITYSTRAKDCRRCGGTSIEWDPKLDVNGNFKLVQDEHLLAQMIEKFELTEIGTDQFIPEIGTSLVALIGSKNANSSAIASLLNTEIQDLGNLIRKIQSSQVEYQNMSTRELLDRITNIKVNIPPENPLIVQVDVTFLTIEGSSESISEMFAINPAQRFFRELGKRAI